MGDESNKRTPPVQLEVSADDATVAYVRFTAQVDVPREVVKCVRLLDLIGKYEGPDIFLDFDKNGVLLGLEILS